MIGGRLEEKVTRKSRLATKIWRKRMDAMRSAENQQEIPRVKGTNNKNFWEFSHHFPISFSSHFSINQFRSPFLRHLFSVNLLQCDEN
jgi:hypothetical protein